MSVFEEGKTGVSGENLSRQSREPTNSAHIACIFLKEAYVKFLTKNQQFSSARASLADVRERRNKIIRKALLLSNSVRTSDQCRAISSPGSLLPFLGAERPWGRG